MRSSDLLLLLVTVLGSSLLAEACGSSRSRRSTSKKNVPLVRSRKSALNGKVAVDIYYETLCPDSRWFFLHQLLPTIKSKVGKHIDLKLVPYGHATTSVNTGGSPSFRCQHGVTECQGNMVHACAIQKWEEAATDKTVERQVKYLSCMIANNYSPLTIGQTCAKEHKVDWGIVKRCYDQEGKKLLRQMGDTTPRVSFIPHVTVNGETTKVSRRRISYFPYSTKSSIRAYRNLQGAVCKTKAVEGC